MKNHEYFTFKSGEKNRIYKPVYSFFRERGKNRLTSPTLSLHLTPSGLESAELIVTKRSFTK